MPQPTKRRPHSGEVGTHRADELLLRVTQAASAICGLAFLVGYQVINEAPVSSARFRRCNIQRRNQYTPMSVPSL